MTDVIIAARQLCKVYRLYAKPHYRFLDMFGLLGRRKGAYTEHAALDRVSLTVRRGEKVAIIGRNGAGKSTLLKLVTRVISPSSGELEVRGRIQALLQIGTGFHPDFTGRENVNAYLAQLGVTGREAVEKVAQIVEFAELEEYIDQPVKTYSTGMAARLMFATSTAITPNILVLDEVLGVGDAYFAQKSYERMRELCDAEGTTLLLVTHDVYSALKIASRIVWIDRGRVLMDGDGPMVIKGYEDSIRLQEEQRLRLKKRQKLRAVAEREGAVKHLLIEIQARHGRPQAAPVFFSEITLLDRDKPIAQLPLGADAFSDEAGCHLQREGTCWGEPTEWNGRPARAMLNYGSPFHKVAGVFAVPAAVADLGRVAFSVRLSYHSELPVEIGLHCFLDGQEADLGPLPPSTSEGWVVHSASHSFSETTATNTGAPRDVNTTGVQGTGTIRLSGIAMVDRSGRETHFVDHGSPATFVIPFEIVKPDLAERAELLVAFHKDGTMTACRIMTRDLFFDAARQRTGRVRLHLPRMALGRGSYSLSVGVARQGYFAEEQTLFYSINPGLYFSLARVMDIEVGGGGIVADGTVFVGDGDWSIEPSDGRS